MTFWDDYFANIEDSAGKQFAMILAERLEAGMCRLRLGGTDPIMAYPRAWREAVKMWRRAMQGQDDDVVSSTILYGLRLVKEHHAYGPNIRHQLIDRMERNLAGGLTIIVIIDA